MSTFEPRLWIAPFPSRQHEHVRTKRTLFQAIAPPVAWVARNRQEKSRNFFVKAPYCILRAHNLPSRQQQARKMRHNSQRFSEPTPEACLPPGTLPTTPTAAFATSKKKQKKKKKLPNPPEPSKEGAGRGRDTGCSSMATVTAATPSVVDRGKRRKAKRGSGAEMTASPKATNSARMMTFNVLCPKYNRVEDGEREASDPERWQERLRGIARLIKGRECTLVFLQEWWADEPACLSILEEELGGEYELHQCRRTGPKEDGLLTMARKGEAEVAAFWPIHFNDCADRVASVARVRFEGGWECLAVNVHLLFPHNGNSRLIRLREAFKLLEALEDIRRRHCLGELPIVLAGDFNGSKESKVFDLLSSQGFLSALEGAGQVTHINHLGEEVDVDRVLLLNPSRQGHGGLTADWRRAAVAMLEEKICLRGLEDAGEAFDELLDREKRGQAGKTDFERLIEVLRLRGEGTYGLTEVEVEELWQQASSTREVLTKDEFRSFLQLNSLQQFYDALRQSSSIWEGRWSLSAEYSSSKAAPSCSTRASLAPLSPHPNDLHLAGAYLPCGGSQGSFPRSFSLSDHVPIEVTLARGGDNH